MDSRAFTVELSVAALVWPQEPLLISESIQSGRGTADAYQSVRIKECAQVTMSNLDDLADSCLQQFLINGQPFMLEES